MIDKNTLDNLKGQEIKELIVNGKIILEDLDASALEKLFDYETDMLCIDEGDVELINACAERMDELNGPLMTEEHFWAVINKVDAEMVSDKKDTAPVDALVTAPARVVKKRIIWKKVWLVAAIVALLISAATMTASAFGFNVFEYFREVIGLSAGEKVDKGTVTLINNGISKEYNSIEELLLNENINVLYPYVLPDGITIKKVDVSKGQNNGEYIQILTNDSSTLITIDTNVDGDVIKGYTEELTVGDYTYYIFKDELFGVNYHHGYYYYVSSDSYENLILIISNMRECK